MSRRRIVLFLAAAAVVLPLLIAASGLALTAAAAAPPTVENKVTIEGIALHEMLWWQGATLYHTVHIDAPQALVGKKVVVLRDYYHEGAPNSRGDVVGLKANPVQVIWVTATHMTWESRYQYTCGQCLWWQMDRILAVKDPNEGASGEARVEFHNKGSIPCDPNISALPTFPALSIEGVKIDETLRWEGSTLVHKVRIETPAALVNKKVVVLRDYYHWGAKPDENGDIVGLTDNPVGVILLKATVMEWESRYEYVACGWWQLDRILAVRDPSEGASGEARTERVNKGRVCSCP